MNMPLELVNEIIMFQIPTYDYMLELKELLDDAIRYTISDETGFYEYNIDDDSDFEPDIPTITADDVFDDCVMYELFLKHANLYYSPDVKYVY